MKILYVALLSILIYLLAAGNILASTFSLSPGKTTISSGSVVPVDFKINTNNESINGVSAYLAYPLDRVEVEWITYSEAFPVQAEESYGEGNIKISRGSFLGETGDVTIATIGFRGKAIGEAVVSFIDGSFAPRTSDSSDSLNFAGSTGATLTIQESQVASTDFFCFLLECIL
ncbi:MAG: cohesin domain-containing protein [Patescibacteria group bacterium]